MIYKNFLTEEMAGKYIGGTEAPISTRTMQRYREEGIAPRHILVGKQVRYRQSDLDAYLKERTCPVSPVLSPSTNDEETRND